MHLKSIFSVSAVALAVVTAPVSAAPELRLRALSDGYVAPVFLLPFPGDDDALVVGDQAGVAYVIDREGKKREKPFLDVRSKLAKLNPGFDERGLLGMAFHPDFDEKPLVYVYYSAPLRDDAPEDWKEWEREGAHTSHVSVFEVQDGAADLASEKVLLRIDEPQFNHNSGGLVFGGDGYLYISSGDGGQGSDKGKGHVEGGNAQDIEQLLGKVLRIDVNSGDPYGIPEDNPFVGKKGRDEIFAWGLRNPWGMSADPDHPSQLITGDVGQDRFEEVNVIRKGANYGWRAREGYHGFDPEAPTSKDLQSGPEKDADGNPFVEPVLVYKNFKLYPDDPDAGGTSITGGLVYQGTAIPELKGKYVFGDWSRQWGKGQGSLFVAERSADKWTRLALPVEGHPDGIIPAYVTGFGADHAGEIFVLTAGQPGFGGEEGAVWKLEPAK